MPPTSGDSTVIDGLKKLLGQLAQLQAAPDAQQLAGPLQQLQQAIIGIIRQGAANDAAMHAAQRRPGGPLGAPGQGPPPGAGGPPPPAAAGMAGPGAPMQGVTPGPTDADELRRMLTASRPGV
jgi:hypothetical protein